MLNQRMIIGWRACAVLLVFSMFVLPANSQEGFSSQRIAIQSATFVRENIQDVNSQRQATAQRTIRAVDFFNYMHNAFCFSDSRARNRVMVRNGEFTPRGRGFFSVRSITYGDLNGDGRDEAVVIVLCNGGGTGNFTEGLIYTMRGGRAVVLAGIEGGDRSDSGIASVRIHDGLLDVGRYGTDSGGACCPEYVMTQTYRLTNNRLTAVGRPVRSPYQDQSIETPPQQISFAPGRTDTVITETIDNLFKTYSVRARAGQRMALRVTSTDANRNNLVMNIGRRGEEYLRPAVTRNLRGSFWSGVLPQDGEYLISVTSYDGVGSMRLEVSITDR